tara:strand:- start:301 stop:1179 length:879 start_codon:yes stop_codon:yes gene_type:complete
MAENKKSSPLHIDPVTAKVLAGAAAGFLLGRRRSGRNNSLQRQLAEAQRKFEERLDAYEKSEFKPLDEDALKQENVMEELEVDTQAQDYAREQFQQQQANIMAGMRGVAGGSGIAGLAQALSNQAKQQARETQVSISEQLRANRAMERQEAARLKAQERAVTLANMQGANQFEIDKMTTLIGVAGEQVKGARQAIADKLAYKGQVAGAVGQVAGAVLGAAIASDRKLKKNINLIGKSPSGLNIYSFEYIDAKYGQGLFQGVMSDEIPQEAVVFNGEHDMVDYSKIDVDFKQI